jgi:hypothetical protein
MWFYTTDGWCKNLALMTGVNVASPGRISFQVIGRSDLQNVEVTEAERKRVAQYIEASRG